MVVVAVIQRSFRLAQMGMPIGCCNKSILKYTFRADRPNTLLLARSTMLKGFRDFILRGNVVDLAIAVVIGAAFTGIVTAFVTDIVNPLIAALVQKPDFSALVLNVNGGILKYGDFLNALISFLLVAFVVYFFVVVPVNKLIAKYFPKPVAPPTTKPCPQCLSDIPMAATRCSHCAQLVA
jgi:large conductance mechanosensitive channel